MPARVYALVGELGAGKTSFSQFFLRALGAQGTITSPTFVIMKPYPVDPRAAHGHTTAYHIDCYRLNDERELAALGFARIVGDPKNIVIVEWADKARSILPPDALWIDFAHGVKEGDRRITIRQQTL